LQEGKRQLDAKAMSAMLMVIQRLIRALNSNLAGWNESKKLSIACRVPSNYANATVLQLIFLGLTDENQT